MKNSYQKRTKNDPRPIQNELKNNGEMDDTIYWCVFNYENKRSLTIKIRLYFLKTLFSGIKP